MRRLLPAGAPGAPAGSSRAEDRPPPPPPPTPTLTAKPPHVAAACEACRRRRTKCSGERPTCGLCQQRGLQCQYRTESAETHGQALKRKFDQVQDRISLYEELFGFLRTMPERDAQDVLRRLRAGADVATLLTHVRSGDILLQLALRPETRLRYDFPYLAEMPAGLLSDNPYLETLTYEGPPATAQQRFGSPDSQRAYLTPVHGAEVVDALLSAASPSLWTAVCSDGRLMRDILGVFFRSEYSFQIAFQKDYFLEDLAAERREFCSALLVNTVLAYSCSCYPRFENRAEYWNPQTLSYRFLVEAKRLWEPEAAQPRITTIQAGILLNLLHNMCGLDKIGRAYSVQAIALAHALRLYDDVPAVRGESSRSADGRVFTAWMLYNYETLVAYHFLHPPLIAKPPAVAPPDPLNHPGWYGEVRLRYPLSQILATMYLGHLLEARCQLRVLMNEISHAAFKDGAKITLDEANIFYARLLAWYDGLPECLKPNYIVHPGHFQLHIHYHSLVTSLFEPFASVEAQDAPLVIERLSGARKYLETLIRIYYLRHGFDETDVFICAPMTLIGFMCIKSISLGIPDAELEATRATLFLVARGLRSQGRSYYLAETLAQVVRGAMCPEEAALMRRLDSPEDNELEGKQTQMQAVHSVWPVSIASKSEDLEANRLTKLVEWFASSNLEEPTIR